jgi:excisionase family DNA binding protein
MAHISISQAVRGWNASRSTINRFIKNGKISAVKNGHRVRLQAAELDRLFDVRQAGDDVSGTGITGTSKRIVTHDFETDDLRQQVSFLKNQLERSQAAESDLRQLLSKEQQNIAMLTDQRQGKGLLEWIFGKRILRGTETI